MSIRCEKRRIGISFLWKRKPVLPFTYAGIRGRLKGVRKKMLFQRVFFRTNLIIFQIVDF